MKILIDWDSTLNNFEEALVRTLNERFGQSYTRDMITDWDWVRNGIPQEQVKYFWNGVFRTKEWTMGLEPTTGSVMAVNRLIDAGHEVHVVSSRRVYMRPWLSEWLKLHGFDSRVVPTIVKIGQGKEHYFIENRMNLWIEDAPHTISILSYYEPGYVIDQPWNRGEVTINAAMKKVKRVPSVWVAVEDILV